MKTSFLLFFVFSVNILLGQVGIGTTNPQETLDVNGAVKIGTTTNTNAGTIRWTGTDFEGYDGTNWIPLSNKKAAFQLWQYANIYFPNNTEISLLLNPGYNYGGGSYNSITGEYTIPHFGVYNIVANISIHYPSNSSFLIGILRVYVNGYIGAQSYLQKNAIVSGYLQNYLYNFSLALNAGDVVSFRFIGTWGGSSPFPYIDRNYTNISIHKVY